MSSSKSLFFFCLSFIGGIFVASFFGLPTSVTSKALPADLPAVALLTAFALGIFLISVFWHHKTFVVAGFCVLFLAAGILRYQLAELRIKNDELRILNDQEENIVLTGIVSGEPDLREKSQRLVVRVAESKILITVWRYPEYRYGDRLAITGRLETPPILDDFNYRNYLKKDGIYSTMTFPEIELLERGAYGSLLSRSFAAILGFKNRLRESLYQNMSPPQSAILGAMLLGDKRQLSEDLRTKLNIAGVRHITAVSGLHVTVLSTMIMSFFLWLGFWRQQAFWLSMTFIALFIVMTGLQPSAVRAGIMGGFFLTAQYLGRQNLSSRAIVLAAAAMLAHNPFLLRLDLGFQLSFLAMFGIIHLMPTFRDWLKFIPFGEAGNILAMTFGAYFWTLPVLIYNFGLVSVAAPLANLLIVPFLYAIMLFGLMFGLVGMIFQSAGWILSWPAWLLLTYLTLAVDFFAKLPLASFVLQNTHWLWLLPSYAFLAFVTWRLKERQRLRFLQY